MPMLYSSTGNSVTVGTDGSYGAATVITPMTGRWYYDNTTLVSVTASGIAAGTETVTVRVKAYYRGYPKEKTITFTADGTQTVKMPLARDDCNSITLEAASDQSSTSATVSADVTGRIER